MAASHLEALLRDLGEKAPEIMQYLGKSDLLRMPSISKTMRGLLETAARVSHRSLFEDLHVSTAYYEAPRDQSIHALRRISNACHQLTIKVLETDRHPDLVFADQPTVSSDWQLIMQELPNVTAVIISVPLESVGKGKESFGNVEGKIEAIRRTLERTIPPFLTTLCFNPIHANGIINCSWGARSARDESLNTSGTLYDRIQIIELGIVNSRNHMNDLDYEGFLQSLRDCLGAFSGRSRTLYFHWLGGMGPNPLMLELSLPPLTASSSDGGTTVWPRPIVWSQLSKVSLSNVRLSRCDLPALAARLPETMKLEVGVEDWSGMLSATRTDGTQAPTDAQLRDAAQHYDGITSFSSPRLIPGTHRAPLEYGQNIGKNE